MLEHIVEKGEGALKLPSVDSLRSLAGVLERGAEVAAASPGGLCVVDGGVCVANLRAQLACTAASGISNWRTIVMCGGCCPAWLVEVVRVSSSQIRRGCGRCQDC